MISQKKFPKSYCYVVGVSGGPDSIFCLDNMRKFGYDLIVAHVNYRKRSNSDDDENIVRSYCYKYSLPFIVRLVNKEEYAFHIGNFQAWARSIRYNFFKEIALKYKTEHIMVAHQYDDLLETYLLQKNRKSLVNYWGLPFVTKWDNFFVHRPLLSYPKTEILKYLAINKIDFTCDETNEMPIYKRNVIRFQVTNLDEKEKEFLYQEIKRKNIQLKQIKLLVNQQKKFLLIPPKTLQLSCLNLSSEALFRLLYYWINKATNGLLYCCKKKKLLEVHRQLFFSKKKNLIINLNNDWKIVKNDKKASIVEQK